MEKKREFGTGKLTTIVTNRSQSKLKGDKVVWNYGNGPENFATGYSLKIESRSSIAEEGRLLKTLVKSSY